MACMKHETTPIACLERRMAEGVPGFSLSEGNGDDDMIATKGLSNRVASQQFPSAVVNRGLIRWANSRRDGVWKEAL